LHKIERTKNKKQETEKRKNEMNIGHIESGLDDGVVVVLVNDTLSFLFEPFDDARRPPFLEVAVLIILTTYSQSSSTDQHRSAA